MRPDCLKYDNCSIPIRLCDDDCSDLVTVDDDRPHPLDDSDQADYLRDMARDKGEI